MGYVDDGACPMLVDGACSIYEHRPRTCRVYDCRLFAALGRVNEDTPLIAARVRAWEFEYADDASRALAEDVREKRHAPAPSSLSERAPTPSLSGRSRTGPGAPDRAGAPTQRRGSDG